MQISAAVEIKALLAIGEFGFGEQLLMDGCCVGVHLTINPDTKGGPRIHLSAWKQMSNFRLNVAKRNIRCLDDCWAIVQEAFFPASVFLPSADFKKKAEAVINASQSDIVCEALKTIERRAMIDFCEELDIGLAEVENLLGQNTETGFYVHACQHE